MKNNFNISQYFMNNLTKIFAILNNLDKRKLDRFRKFLISPYFNLKDEMIELFDFIEVLLPKAKKEMIYDVDFFSNKFFAPRSFNKNTQQQATATFINLLEEFIIIESIDLRKENFLVELSKYYLNNNLKDCFNDIKNKFDRKLDKKAVKNDLDFFWCFKLIFNFYLFNIRHVSDRKRTAVNEGWLKLMQMLKTFYLITQLKLNCFALNDGHIINASYNQQEIEKLLIEAEKPEMRDVIIINAYYNCLLFLKDNKNEVNYFELKDLLIKDVFAKLPKEEKMLLDFAINYCIIMHNSGHDMYTRELFSMYKLAINRKSFYVNKYLFSPTVKNIVTIGISLNELEWVENFLTNYKKKFNPKYSEEIYNYNFAHLSFANKEFGKTLSYINKGRFKDVFFEIDMAKLKLKVHYEQYNINDFSFDDLEKEINTFNVNIHRKGKGNITDKQIVPYSKFILYLGKLHDNHEKEKLDKIYEEVKDIELIAERKWLLEKIKEKIK